MIEPESQAKLVRTDSEEGGRLAVLQRFKVEDIQHLGKHDLLAIQSLAGHGDLWGRWQTPSSLGNIMNRTISNFDLTRRVRANLVKEEPTVASVDQLVE